MSEPLAEVRTTQGESQASVENVRELIKEIKVAMLTTAGNDGTLHSCPVETQQTEFETPCRR